MIGCGVAAVGWKDINWQKLITIVIGWFVAPAVAIILASLFFIAVVGLTLKEAYGLGARLFFQQTICGIAAMLIYVMIISLTLGDG